MPPWPHPADRPSPLALEPKLCTRFEVAAFARTVLELGVGYLGLCCGAAPHLIRSMAEELGRTPPASRYSPDLSKPSTLGTDPRLTAHARERANGSPPRRSHTTSRW